MYPSWVLSLRDGVTWEENGEEATLGGCYGRVKFGQSSRGVIDSLQRLASPGATIASLVDAVQHAEGSAAAATLCIWLRRLISWGFVQAAVYADGQALASLVSVAPVLTLPPNGGAQFRLQVLSRFAYLRRIGTTLALESPRSMARVILHDHRAAALVHCLVRPSAAIDLPRLTGMSDESVSEMIGLLAATGMLTEAKADRTTIEDELAALQSWEFHDLLFHARSREGRYDAPVGAFYRLAGRLPMPPACKPIPSDPGIELPRPDLQQKAGSDPPFAVVVEARRSIRHYANQPLSLSQLGEFLYRCARILRREEIEVETWSGLVRMELTFRPYPAGGALHELELYAVVQACSDLAAGIYHYDALDHRLRRISEPTAETRRLLENASRSSGIPEEKLQVLFVVAARFQRLAWKYSSMAYALTLKNVGALYQTMYLAATAMNLAPCALGAGDSDLFSRAIGSDYYSETSVGEFLLGSRCDSAETKIHD